MTVARFPIPPRPDGQTLTPAVVVIPLTLELDAAWVKVEGQLEPTTSVSLLPHTIGVRLGATWTGGVVPTDIPGQPEPVPTIPLLVRGKVGRLPPTRLVFAWAATDTVPLILGQLNFLHKYDICLHHTRGQIEVRPAVRPRPS